MTYSSLPKAPASCVPAVSPALAICLLLSVTAFSTLSFAQTATPEWNWSELAGRAATVALNPAACRATRDLPSCASVTVTAAGAGIGRTRDDLLFVHRQLVGDGTLIARVSSLQREHAAATVGIMIRETLSPGARQASLVITAGRRVAFDRRRTTGGASARSAAVAAAAPVWLKLERRGNIVTGYRSSDLVAWTKLGSDTLALPRTIYVGLAVASGTDRASTRAVFTNVSTWEWVLTDVGRPAIPGMMARTSGVISMRGSGRGFTSTSDQFTFAHRSIAGNSNIVARLLAVNALRGPGQVGLTVRASLDGDAAHVTLMANADNTLTFERRIGSGFPTARTTARRTGPLQWLKLERRGESVSAFVSGDGREWTFVASEVVDLPGSVLAGVAAGSQSSSGLVVAMLDQVAVDGAPTTVNLPPSVTLTAPAPEALLDTRSVLTIAADAIDRDGSITRVDFFADGALLASDTTAPYTFTWAGMSAGLHRVSAVAHDDAGTPVVSAERLVTVAAVPSLPAKRYRLAFTSRDHNTLVRDYVVEAFRAGVDVTKATPLQRVTVPKPSGIGPEVTIDITALVQALPAGTFVFTVAARGDASSARSVPSPPLVR
jgi:hypothetical protein